MSKERDRYFFEFSQPFTIHDDCEILKRMGLTDPHYELKLSGNIPPLNPTNTVGPDMARLGGQVNPMAVPSMACLTQGLAAQGLGMGMGLGMMGLGPRLHSPLGIPGTNVPPPPVGLSQIEQLQLAQIQQQQNLRNQLMQDQNRQKVLQHQLQLQLQLQQWQEQHRQQQLQQPPPVQVKIEAGPTTTTTESRSPIAQPPPPTILNGASQTK